MSWHPAVCRDGIIPSHPPVYGDEDFGRTGLHQNRIVLVKSCKRELALASASCPLKRLSSASLPREHKNASTSFTLCWEKVCSSPSTCTLPSATSISRRSAMGILLTE